MHVFSDDDEQALTLLLDEFAGEDALDYAATHGLLCAVVAGPAVDEATWIQTVFDGEPAFPEAGQAERCIALLRLMHADLAHRFYRNERMALPCPLRPGHERLESWCVGFMEGVFLNEADWLGEDVDPEVSHLLMPVFVESDLIDLPEGQDLRRNRPLREAMVRELPENLIDLYLMYHASEPRSGEDDQGD